ncbi:hypothetical protein [uncultured Apibacter sp.]|uniref:hypothetical protein n=1 Tax=uncultured Apibacter sp. TaxID=1778616 RepID=UPI0025DB79A6|nr:hypothetical protein [uncultured Apibacter sp.]
MRFPTSQDKHFYYSAPCYNYKVQGTSKYKHGENYTENHFKADVYYKENRDFTDYKITNFSQSAKAIVYELAQDFFTITSDLQVQLDSKEYVEKICNLEDIFQKYQQQKPLLLEKYKNVPNIETLVENYEANLQKEEKLRKSIFYKGISRVFFTGLKPIIRSTTIQHEITRTRNCPEPIFSVSFPITETIYWRKEGDKYKVEIKGNVDFKRMEQDNEKDRFLQACSNLVDNQVKPSDVALYTQEKYTLDHRLNYETADYLYSFGIQRFHEKKETLHYHLKT